MLVCSSSATSPKISKWVGKRQDSGQESTVLASVITVNGTLKDSTKERKVLPWYRYVRVQVCALKGWQWAARGVRSVGSGTPHPFICWQNRKPRGLEA